MSIPTLRNTIHQMASQFAAGVLEVIRGASLDEILAEAGSAGATRRPGRPAASIAVVAPAAGGRGARRKGGRLARRSADDIAGVVGRIVSLLASKPKGLRAEQIRDELGLEAKELPRPIAEALAAKRIGKSGQKRATTYFVKSGSARPVAAPKASKANGAVKKGAAKAAPAKAAPTPAKAAPSKSGKSKGRAAAKSGSKKGGSSHGGASNGAASAS